MSACLPTWMHSNHGRMDEKVCVRTTHPWRYACIYVLAYVPTVSHKSKNILRLFFFLLVEGSISYNGICMLPYWQFNSLMLSYCLSGHCDQNPSCSRDNQITSFLVGCGAYSRGLAKYLSLLRNGRFLCYPAVCIPCCTLQWRYCREAEIREERMT